MPHIIHHDAQDELARQARLPLGKFIVYFFTSLDEGMERKNSNTQLKFDSFSSSFMVLLKNSAANLQRNKIHLRNK